MTFRVELTTRAQDDLDRLFDFLVERELARADGDLALAARAIAAIRDAVSMLERAPLTCRKAGEDGSVRELVISFGATGYVALFDVTPDEHVLVFAISHQREEDYGD